jgi:hypothetical protein
MIRPITASSFNAVGLSMSARAGGRAQVPVQPSNYLYAHFKHVSGFPAPEGVAGVPVNKLKILDAIIERLSQVRKNAVSSPEQAGFKDEKQLDALIMEYQKQLSTAISHAGAAAYTANAQIPAGSFVNIAA